MSFFPGLLSAENLPNNMRLPNFSKPPKRPRKKNVKSLQHEILNGTLTKPGDEELDGLVDDEELGVAETYADYMPAKLKLGKKHPDPVVETTSLSSVAPADIWYELSLPAETIDTGALSALQLESVTYACQAHENILPDGTRAGFLIGDGAGVGKGRTIAGVIFENFMKGRVKAIWVSVSTDLKYDAERDLSDIGADEIPVYQLNKFKYGKISTSARPVSEGVMFSTYSALIGKSSMKGVCNSRLGQLLEWCGEDFDGVLVFDECHRAKNLCPEGALSMEKKPDKEKKKPTKTGLAVLELQMKLPKARVVYASATGASEPKNMAYMTRLGLWGEGTSFRVFEDFIAAVERRGVGAMEIVAMDMKLRGTYIARQLSFHGVTFHIEQVPLTKEFEDVYNDSAKLWVEAMQKFEEASGLVHMIGKEKQIMWRLFWSAHQRFFKYLCIAAKVRHAVSIAHEAVKSGKCVVIGLQSTGEARTLEQLEKDEGELSDFVSTPKAVFENLVEKQFPSFGNKEDRELIKRKPQKSVLIVENDAKDKEEPSNKRKVRRSARTASKRLKLSNEKEVTLNRSKYELSDDENDEMFNPNGSAYETSEDDSESEIDWWKSRDTKTKGKKSRKGDRQDDDDSKLEGKWTMEDPKSDGKKLQKEAPLPPPPTHHFMSSVQDVFTMKQDLLSKIDLLGKKLPPNTLDQLIDELGGPEVVAEMTGRKGRVIHTKNGGVQYETRAEKDVSLEALNLTEKQRFMDGQKNVAIISEAASTGISLQSDRRVKNQKRRVHITLELPWSADRAIQQFGRTHRSNQVNAPEYVFLITNLAGERRFASIVAKRLESLGALTHGDRRATEARDLSQFNVDNKYGREALQSTLKAVKGEDTPLVPAPQDYEGDFFRDVYDAAIGVGLLKEIDTTMFKLVTKEYVSMAKFLNRILGLPVELQNRLFRYFTDTLDAIISREKRYGRYDAGIQDLGAGGEVVKRIRTITFLHKHATGTAPVELHTFHVERGITWSQALEKISRLQPKDYAFYVSRDLQNGNRSVRLVVAVASTASKPKSERLFLVYKPNTGLQFKKETLADLEMRNKKVGVDEAEKIWREMFEKFLSTCAHTYWMGSCAARKVGFECEVGMTRRTYHVVAGSVMGVWGTIERALKDMVYFRMQVIRLKTEDDQKIIGLFMPKNCVDLITEALSETAEDVKYTHFTDVQTH